MVTSKHIGIQVNTPDGQGELLYIHPEWDNIGKPVGIIVKKLTGDIARVKFLNEAGDARAEWYSAGDCSPALPAEGYLRQDDGDRKIMNSLAVQYTKERTWQALLLDDESIMFSAKYLLPDGTYAFNQMRLSQKTTVLLTDFLNRVFTSFSVDFDGVSNELHKEIEERQIADGEEVLRQSPINDGWCVEYDVSLFDGLAAMSKDMNSLIPTGVFKYFGVQKDGTLHFSDEQFGFLITSEQFAQTAEAVRAGKNTFANHELDIDFVKEQGGISDEQGGD